MWRGAAAASFYRDQKGIRGALCHSRTGVRFLISRNMRSRSFTSFSSTARKHISYNRQGTQRAQRTVCELRQALCRAQINSSLIGTAYCDTVSANTYQGATPCPKANTFKKIELATQRNIADTTQSDAHNDSSNDISFCCSTSSCCGMKDRSSSIHEVSAVTSLFSSAHCFS